MVHQWKIIPWLITLLILITLVLYHVSILFREITLLSLLVFIINLISPRSNLSRINLWWGTFFLFFTCQSRHWYKKTFLKYVLVPRQCCFRLENRILKNTFLSSLKFSFANFFLMKTLFKLSFYRCTFNDKKKFAWDNYIKNIFYECTSERDVAT